jgi:hypothetical protein
MLLAWSRTGGTRVWSWRMRTRCGTHGGFGGLGLKTTQRYGWRVFAEFGPQNSAVAVPEGTSGVMCRDRGGCVKAKKLHVKDVVVGSKT